MNTAPTIISPDDLSVFAAMAIKEDEAVTKAQAAADYLRQLILVETGRAA
jgi:hypothetical protein